MVFICWFVFLDYVFLIKCFDYFSLLEILGSWHTTNTLHGFTITRYLAVEKEMLSQLALLAESVESFLHQQMITLVSKNLLTLKTRSRSSRPEMFCKEGVPKNL